MPVVSPVLRRVRRVLDAVPRPVRLVLAAGVVLLGVVIVLRPTTTLGVAALLIGAGMVLHGLLVAVDAGTGTADRDEPAGAADARARPPESPGASTSTTPPPGRTLPVLRAVAGLAWVVAGLLVLTWPGLTVRMLAVTIAVLLLAHGVTHVLEALRPGVRGADRLVGLLDGAAGIVLGLLAWLWPDLTLLVVSAALGVRLAATGLLTLWRTARPRAAGGDPSARRRVAASGLVLLLAVAAAVTSAAVRDGSPVVDDFYAAPRNVPDAPGELIRAEPFTRGVPEAGRAWRILYTTTAGDGSPAVASGVVVVPAEGAGDWPVIDWAHGTTGVARQCAPSLAAEPFESGALFVLPEILAQGWALVATDYLGLGTAGHHPYVVGQPSAHAVLDARRAAADLAEADLGEQTVVWGHSQGGGAALWTAAVAEDYAPDVPLAGTVALAPAADLPALMETLDSITGGSVFASFVIDAYAAEYADVHVRDYVRPGAEATVRAMASRCLAEPAVLASLLGVLGMAGDPDITSADPLSGPLGDRLAENVPPATMTAPVLLGQGEADTLIDPGTQQEYSRTLCEAGAPVDYQSWTGLDHLGLVAADSPAIGTIIDWTADRFAGRPPPAGDC